MRSADEFTPGRFDDWTLRRNREVHRQRLKQPKGLTDMSSPKKYSHLDPSAKKQNTQKKRAVYDRIDYENRLLLSKMNRIAMHGSQAAGAPPPRPRPPKTPRKGSQVAKGGNSLVRKHEQERIARENLDLLRRINDADPEYSTNKFALAERQRVQHLAQLGRFRRPGFVSNLRNKTGSSTSRTPRDRRSHSIGYDGVDPARQVLARIDPSQMVAVLSMTKPPGSARSVFSAMMILVSPFEPRERDLSWDAVVLWVEALGGAEKFLTNLWNFNMGLVPVTNGVRATEYLEDHNCDHDGLARFNPAVAYLQKWIHTVCASVQPLTEREARSKPPPRRANPKKVTKPKAEEKCEEKAPEEAPAAAEVEEAPEAVEEEEPEEDEGLSPEETSMNARNFVDPEHKGDELVFDPDSTPLTRQQHATLPPPERVKRNSGL